MEALGHYIMKALEAISLFILRALGLNEATATNTQRPANVQYL